MTSKGYTLKNFESLNRNVNTCFYFETNPDIPQTHPVKHTKKKKIITTKKGN